MSFNPDDFINSSITGANDTKVIPCPVGEYQAIVSKIVPRQWQSKDGSQTGIALDVFWSVEDQNVKSFVGREEVAVKQGIMLDTTDGRLDMSTGKNIGLGRLREAVGLNDPDRAFSFNQLPGQMAKVKVNHREDKNDPSVVYAEVVAVAKL